jgi:hypothetical protein
MSDWLFITAVLAIVFMCLIILVLYYFTRYVKPVSKPTSQVQELIDPENEEETSKTIRFV